jgi:hypothetical protein
MLQLQSILANLYRTNDRALDIADRAGLSVTDIPQSPVPKSTWWGILREAENQLLLDRVIEISEPGTKARQFRNEGIAIAAVRAGLAVNGIVP